MPETVDATKINDPSEPLDYRYGGETWDSFSLKYMATIPYIFRVLNAINGTDDTGVVLPLPSGEGELVRKNADGTVSVSVTGNAATATKLKTARKISLTGDASGSVNFDGSANVSLAVSSVTGNANKIVNKQVDAADISDGAILVYRSFDNKFVFESKGTIGAGKTLTITNGSDVLGTFSGDEAETIDLAPTLQAVANGAAGGNSATATKLQTARSINGTSFDGSANITTARWGSARNITIKDADATNAGTAVSVNGSANVILPLPSTIKANITGNVSGSSGSCTGNASTATKLATARTINGTNFDGSAAITTSKWGVARNFSIKDSSSTNTGTAVSVDGSGNVTILLPATIKANITGDVSGKVNSHTVNADVPSGAKFTDTTYSNFVKSGSGAKAGLVPAPSTTAGNTKYLREDGTWEVPPNTNTTYTAATATPKANGTAAVGTSTKYAREDHVHPLQTTITGNAATATKIKDKTIAVVSSFNSSTGVLALVSG